MSTASPKSKAESPVDGLPHRRTSPGGFSVYDAFALKLACFSCWRGLRVAAKGTALFAHISMSKCLVKDENRLSHLCRWPTYPIIGLSAAACPSAKLNP